MKRNRFFIIIFILVTAACILGGCSLKGSFESWIGDQLKEKSGITEDESYVQYEKNLNEGLLDSEGRLYKEEVISVREMHGGPIHVTFAENRNITVSYYSDSSHSTLIDPSDCYLNPGDRIYVSDIIYDPQKKDNYVFSGFRFIEYDQEGNRLGETDGVTESGGIISISPGFTGTELAIEPVGNYKHSEE